MTGPQSVDDALVMPMPSGFEYPPDDPDESSSSSPTPPSEKKEDDSGQEFEPRPFDPRYKEPLTGLLYLGELTKELTLFGHRFRISTPSQLRRLMIGPVIKPYQETLSAEIAYMTATVAAYLETVDGQSLPEPVLASAQGNEMYDRFTWVTENIISKELINMIYQECLMLDAEVTNTLVAMEKA